VALSGVMTLELVGRLHGDGQPGDDATMVA
jgi:hypothetical protein